jgi:hypothetical protein
VIFKGAESSERQFREKQTKFPTQRVLQGWEGNHRSVSNNILISHRADYTMVPFNRFYFPQSYSNQSSFIHSSLFSLPTLLFTL